MNKILLFDFDGTIADSFDNFIEIIEASIKKYHLNPIPKEEYEILRSKDAKALIKRLGIPFYKIPFVGRFMKSSQLQVIDGIEPFYELLPVLRKLKENGYTLGIVTSNGKENVNRFIEKNSLDIFTYVYCDISSFRKHKAIKSFLKNTSLTPDEIIYIGDEIRDIHACQKAGVKIIAVGWGYTTKEGLAKAHPDFLIETPEELLQLLESTI